MTTHRITDKRDGRSWGIRIQTENTVRHTKCGRMKGMVVGEGGRSTGVLLYNDFKNILTYNHRFNQPSSRPFINKFNFGVIFWIICSGMWQFCVSRTIRCSNHWFPIVCFVACLECFLTVSIKFTTSTLQPLWASMRLYCINYCKPVTTCDLYNLFSWWPYDSG